MHFLVVFQLGREGEVAVDDDAVSRAIGDDIRGNLNSLCPLLFVDHVKVTLLLDIFG
jgi:hypothetical protein